MSQEVQGSPTLSELNKFLGWNPFHQHPLKRVPFALMLVIHSNSAALGQLLTPPPVVIL